MDGRAIQVLRRSNPIWLDLSGRPCPTVSCPRCGRATPCSTGSPARPLRGRPDWRPFEIERTRPGAGHPTVTVRVPRAEAGGVRCPFWRPSRSTQAHPPPCPPGSRHRRASEEVLRAAAGRHVIGRWRPRPTPRSGKGRRRANGTINRELAILIRMLAAGLRTGKLVRLPVIRKLRAAAARGFFEREQFRPCAGSSPGTSRSRREHRLHLRLADAERGARPSSAASWTSTPGRSAWTRAPRRTTRAGWSTSRRSSSACWRPRSSACGPSSGSSAA